MEKRSTRRIHEERIIKALGIEKLTSRGVDFCDSVGEVVPNLKYLKSVGVSASGVSDFGYRKDLSLECLSRAASDVDRMGANCFTIRYCNSYHGSGVYMITLLKK